MRAAFVAVLVASTCATCAAPRATTASTPDSEPTSAVQACETLYGQPLFMSNDLVVWSRVHDGSQVALVVSATTPGRDAMTDDVLPRVDAGMKVVAVCARQSNELYVLGRVESGATVLERWSLGEPAGAPFLHFVRSGTHRGTPVPWRPDEQIRWGISSEAAGPRTVAREEILRTQLGADAWWMQVDVDGRYVLVGTHEPELVVQLWIDGSGERVHLCDDRDAPGLGRTSSLNIGQHVEHGRVFWLHVADEAGTRCVFTDPDNDGVYAAPVLIPEERWEADGWNSAVWYRPSMSDWTTELPSDE